MQQYTLQTNQGKLLQGGMYVIQLNNGEQHYVQATSAVLSSATPTATAITINPTDQLQTQTYLQQNTLGQTIQTVQPHEAAVIQQQNDSFQDILDYIQHLYTELAKEKAIRHYICLFCTQDFNDLRSLLRHTSFSHRTKILDGTISLEQDFEALIRKKIQAKEQQSQNQQLYQCVQCQQMFNSLEIISEHLTHCQPPSATITNVVPSSNSASYQQGKTTSTELVNTSANKSHVAADQYIPYGCAQCGRRYHTIRDLMVHMRTCQDETFYDAAHHLQNKNWVEAPKNQHIVINEEATNVVLKTTGLWLMPEPPGQQIGTEALRGFWVMPSSTSEYIEEQIRQQQEKIRIEQEQKRIQEEQEEQARLRREEEERQQLLIQRQILEQQQKLRLQQQLDEQQKQQMLLQQQLQRQTQSVVQTISSVPNTVPIVKSSPTAVISHQSQSNIQAQRPHSVATTNTIIVLNDEQIFSQSGSDTALRCIQTSDGSYHVIGNVDLNERQVTNTTSVIAHTSPTIESTPPPPPPPSSSSSSSGASGRKRRGRAPKQNNTYTQQQNDSDLITLENVYQPPEPTTVTANKVTNSKRRRGAQQTIDNTPSANSIDSNQTVIQNVDAIDIPPQQFYLAYNDNGVLVPIETTSTLAMKNDSQGNAVDLSQEQYIIEDLDASRKAQQKSARNKSSSSSRVQSQMPPTPSQPSTTATTSTVTAATNPARVIVPDSNASDLSAYNIDDLSHLDKPITSEKPSTPIKPLKTKPQFMDSFFSFLMNRESNKL
ncbi:putative mediator of RNA polymerase II transcription subunit 26 [Sitodiplosis mosellana]|uniref:putative mediator of RNA polymerase II transcription subunit 26 n=1 Tax=Sitodiplosis mosellana TaxID=263140 RepID=UPI00244384EA|nr:putative mediator of RNA polymerase II transcription subunit 26 [Sitodiplosis mosellana]